MTTLRLDYCGRIDCSVLEAWSTALPNLKHLELLGPFLVRVPAWLSFINSHPQLESFLVTQSPRFDLECIKALANSCKGLTKLRLKEIVKMNDDFLEYVGQFEGLTYLELSYPGIPEALSEEALIDLMSAVGGGLTHLDLSNNRNITDGFLFQGIKPFARHLSTLVLANAPELTDAGVAEFFDNWATAADQRKRSNEARPLTYVDMSRNHELGTKALESLLKHSGRTLTHLNINGWRAVSQESLKGIARCSELKQADLGWCREVDDWVVKDLMEKCEMMRELKVWGCQRITNNCPRRVSGVWCRGAILITDVQFSEKCGDTRSCFDLGSCFAYPALSLLLFVICSEFKRVGRPPGLSWVADSLSHASKSIRAIVCKTKILY